MTLRQTYKAAAAYRQQKGGGHDDDGPEPEPEPVVATPDRGPSAGVRRGSMTLQDALRDGLISKASFDKYMDKYLKETFGVSSYKELAELKRQHRMARQHQKGSGVTDDLEGGHYA